MSGTSWAVQHPWHMPTAGSVAFQSCEKQKYPHPFPNPPSPCQSGRRVYTFISPDGIPKACLTLKFDMVEFLSLSSETSKLSLNCSISLFWKELNSRTLKCDRDLMGSLFKDQKFLYSQRNESLILESYIPSSKWKWMGKKSS